MRHGPFILRATALLSAGMLGVHDLRYRIAGHGDHALEHAHGYLSAIGPLVAVLLLLAAGHLLHLVAHGGVHDRRRPQSTMMLWALAAGALMGAFGAQELIEGALAHGHPAGLDAILGDGGWIAAPLASAAGGLTALALRGADEILRAAGRSPITVARACVGEAVPPQIVVGLTLAPLAPLARLGAGRAPPSVSA